MQISNSLQIKEYSSKHTVIKQHINISERFLRGTGPYIKSVRVSRYENIKLASK